MNGLARRLMSVVGLRVPGEKCKCALSEGAQREISGIVVVHGAKRVGKFDEGRGSGGVGLVKVSLAWFTGK